MKISEQVINTVMLFLLIIMIADACITRAEHVEKTKVMQQHNQLIGKYIEATKANTVALEKVEIEQKISNELLEIITE